MVKILSNFLFKFNMMLKEYTTYFRHVMARCGGAEFALIAGMVIGGSIMIICGLTVVREYDLSKVRPFEDNFLEIVTFRML